MRGGPCFRDGSHFKEECRKPSQFTDRTEIAEDEDEQEKRSPFSTHNPRLGVPGKVGSVPYCGVDGDARHFWLLDAATKQFRRATISAVPEEEEEEEREGRRKHTLEVFATF